MSGSKRYAATIHLGVETDTYDPEGRIVCEKAVPDVTPEVLEEALEEFVGEIDQIPPAYSAVHVNGERAYRLARKGQPLDLPTKKVIIHEIRLLSVDLPGIRTEVFCSRGTYLRTLAFDLGRLLKVGAHLGSLRRLSSGPFNVNDAVKSDDLQGPGGRKIVMDHLIPLPQALPDAREVNVSEVMAAKIRNGYKPSDEEIIPGAADIENGGGLVRLLCDGELVAVIEMAAGSGNNKNNSKTMRVFH
jgi:tRNA pseudouridine55 synthase